MRTLKIALLATVATAALSSATFAADLIIADPVIDNTYSFDWEGPYAGLYVSGDSSPAFGLGADLGVNVLIDTSLLAGVEGNLAGYSDGTWDVEAHGRLGYVSDSALFYGLLGVGWNSTPFFFVPVGVGVEFAVADNLSLKAEYNYQWGPNIHLAKVGFNWHF
ncbi:MAG: outer membrane protein [Devosia sp.]